MAENLVCSQVAVLMPVYNAEKYLAEAIDSILEQTYNEFDFYIINDGSTDSSEKIILSFNDKRIRYIKNETNIGLIGTLNKGLSLISNRYIVRMDADDIAFPDRIQAQVEFMEAHPEISVSGTQIQYFGNSNEISRFPLEDNHIKAHLIFINVLAHPSLIIRNSFIKEHHFVYNSDYIHIEDYELWLRIAEKGRFANLNKVLLKYRLDGQNITVKNWHTREDRVKKIYAVVIEKLNIPAHDNNIRLHLELAGNSKKINNIKEVKQYLDLLLQANKKLDTQIFEKIIHQYWEKLFFKLADNKSLKEVLTYWRLSRGIKLYQLRYAIAVFKNK